jgi:2-dehydropantoate 2-reductase
MKIAIIGGGSIGLLFTYYLSDAFDVTLYTRTLQQAKVIKKSGIELVCNGETKSRKVHVKTFDQWKSEEAITFVAVKQYHLSTLLHKLKDKAEDDINLVFLQNGMSHLQQLEELRNKNIYVCTVEHGAFKSSANTVVHNGQGQTGLALFQGDMKLPSSLFALQNFPIVFKLDYYEMLIRKLVVNAIINPLTAILKVTNGEIIRNKQYFMAAQQLFIEVSDILELENKEGYFEMICEICLKTSENRSSMLKDMELSQQTEIDSILGYILEEAHRKKIQAPISEMLYLFIKGSER